MVKVTTQRNATSRNSKAPHIPHRRDGFIELAWYHTFKFYATEANNGQGYDVMLSGPASSGKTTAAYMLAHDLRYDIVVQQCHRRVEVEEFRGTRSIVPGEAGMPVTGFDPGSLTLAVQRCATSRGIVYLIDEINLVDPAMLAILNNLTQRDAHSCLVIPELSTSYPRPPNLIIVGTKNPEYAGTNQLSEAFLSRIVLLECPMMGHKELRDITLAKFPRNPDMVDITVRVMQYIETARINEQHQWEPDLRTMLQFLDLWLIREPKWKRGQPFITMSVVFESVIGPKIGWCDTTAAVRSGLIASICTSLGKGLPIDDDGLAEPLDDV